MAGYLERARTEGTPLIDGDTVTFFWEGKEPPDLIADFSDWLDDPLPLQPAGRDAWIYTRQLPLDAYLEYSFLEPATGERLTDPYNPRKIPNGLGDINNYFYMPEARPARWIRRRPGAARGALTRHYLQTDWLVSGVQREVYLYRPPAQGPYPLLVVLDGPDYRRRGKILQTVENLMAQNRIRPIALALVANGGPARWPEYACSEGSLVFLKETVLPFAEQQLDLIDPTAFPGSHGVIGPSMGGLMALFAGLRFPEIFGKIFCQSAAFQLYGYRSVVADLVRCSPVQPLKVWMDAGLFETHLPSNREMAALLAEKGYQLNYHEHPGGHNFTSWRNVLWRGLEYLFPSSERMLS
jgi:enterochelin esterase-like enzyme